MICVPKKYTDKTVGGYLLNEEKYVEGIFIDKKGYAFPSQLENNDIYQMVNNIHSTPFKVNKDLMNNINLKGVEQNLIIDPTIEHEYENLEELKAHKKKVSFL